MRYCSVHFKAFLLGPFSRAALPLSHDIHLLQNLPAMPMRLKAMHGTPPTRETDMDATVLHFGAFLLTIGAFCLEWSSFPYNGKERLQAKEFPSTDIALGTRCVIHHAFKIRACPLRRRKFAGNRSPF